MFVAMRTADGRLRPAGSSTVLSSRLASSSAAISAHPRPAATVLLDEEPAHRHSWGHDTDRAALWSTWHRVEPTTKTGEDGLRKLDVNLRPNPIADAITAAQAQLAEAAQQEPRSSPARPTRSSSTTSPSVPLDWTRLASSLPTLTSVTAAQDA
jgi:hypothetical protein